MASRGNTPRGILKNKGSSAPTAAQKRGSNPRDIAIQHARIIHSRREIEEQISESMLELSKYPVNRDAMYNASNPSPTDAESFTSHVRLYQPSDYDDLIEERNANGLCGYTLCPNQRSRVTGGGVYKLVNYGRKDFTILPKKELEKWCSQKCAKRAMYIKVQLNEWGVWERAGIPTIQIELLEEERGSSANDPSVQQAKDAERMEIEAQEKKAQNAMDLAMERGDNNQNGKTPKRTFNLAIRERPAKAPAAPSLSADGQGHLITEGYKSTFRTEAEKATREGNDEGEDTPMD